MAIFSKVAFCGILALALVSQTAFAVTPCRVELSALKRSQSKSRSAERKVDSSARLVEKETDRKATRIEYYEYKMESELARSRGYDDARKQCLLQILFGGSVRRCSNLASQSRRAAENAEKYSNSIVTAGRIADGKILRAQKKLDAALILVDTTADVEAKAQESYDLCITLPAP